MIKNFKQIILSINEIDKIHKKDLLNEKKLKLYLEEIENLIQINRELNSKLKFDTSSDIDTIAKNLLYMRAQLIDIETTIKDIKILIEESVDKLLANN